MATSRAQSLLTVKRSPIPGWGRITAVPPFPAEDFPIQGKENKDGRQLQQTFLLKESHLQLAGTFDPRVVTWTSETHAWVLGPHNVMASEWRNVLLKLIIAE